MEFRILPKTGLRVSRLSLGTMTMGAQVDETTALRMVDYSLDTGINFIDTANVYNHGVTESILGKALKGRRDRVVLATKAGLKMGDAPDEQGLSRAAVHNAINASLRRLQTDYVDVYYLHQPDYATPIEETLEAMDEVVQAGKVRFPAVSNYAAWQIAEIICICENRGYQPFRISQPMYNLLARAIEEEFLAFSKRFNVAVVPYNPLAGGLLTGKHSPETGPPAGTRFHDNKLYQDRYWRERDFTAVKELSAIAQEANLTLLELSLQWLLSQPSVDSVILGASSLEQLQQNVKAAEFAPLDPSLLARCDEVWQRLRGVTPKYNR